MDKKIETLHKLCEALTEELDEYSKKIEKSDGMSAGDLEAIDKLSHALKSIKTTIAMMEADDDGGYSNRGYMPYYGGRSYENGTGNMGGGNSYARGRNAKRDSMGRYSRDGGYSYAEDIEQTKEEIRDLAMKMPEEDRRKITRVLDDLR